MRRIVNKICFLHSSIEILRILQINLVKQNKYITYNQSSLDRLNVIGWSFLERPLKLLEKHLFYASKMWYLYGTSIECKEYSCDQQLLFRTGKKTFLCEVKRCSLILVLLLPLFFWCVVQNIRGAPSPFTKILDPLYLSSTSFMLPKTRRLENKVLETIGILLMLSSTTGCLSRWREIQMAPRKSLIT